MHLKVGELARQSGVSIRTLHHYDEIGLLTPSHRSATGYRLYIRQDVMQLHRILALKQLGLSLADIADTLASSGGNLDLLIAQQLQNLNALCWRSNDLVEFEPRINPSPPPRRICQGWPPSAANLGTKQNPRPQTVRGFICTNSNT